jgi:hypothetical protein
MAYQTRTVVLESLYMISAYIYAVGRHKHLGSMRTFQLTLATSFAFIQLWAL